MPGDSYAGVDGDEVLEKTVNANGQIYLGRNLGGRTVRVTYEVLDQYTCDECGETFELADVAIFDRGGDDERVVCTDCLAPEDRIIS